MDITGNTSGCVAANSDRSEGDDRTRLRVDLQGTGPRRRGGRVGFVWSSTMAWRCKLAPNIIVTMSVHRFVLASLAVATLVGLHACSSEDPAGGRAPPDAIPEAGAVGPTDGAVRPTDGGAGATLYKSGARLRAEVERVEGETIFKRFYDTARKETCVFEPMKDGGYRCLPSTTSVLYSDTGCGTMAGAGVITCPAGVKYASVRGLPPSECGGDLPPLERLFELGDPLGVSEVHERLADGTCLPRAATMTALGAEVALAAFVHATAEPVAMTETLAVVRLTGDDGSQVVLESFVDRTRDAHCRSVTFGGPSAPTRACVPARWAFSEPQTGPYEDPSCTVRAAAYARKASCPPPELVIRAERVDAGAAGACASSGRATSLHAVGAPLPTAYSTTTGSCAVAAHEHDSFFALGASLPASTFPPLELGVHGAGSVRVQALGQGGVRLAHGVLFHAPSKSSCSAIKFADGKRYCFADDTLYYSELSRYKDAACTQPVYVARTCGVTPKQIATKSGNGDACDREYASTVRPLGPKLAIAAYYEMTTTCEGPTPLTADEGAYDVLPAVPASTRLAEVTLVRE